MLFLAISIFTLNIILWVVLLIRFKNLFSTDKIIENTREKVNRIIKDVDTATDRNTYLTKEMQRRLEKAVQDAETRMELFNQATERLRDMIAEADRINKGSVPAAKVKYVESEIEMEPERVREPEVVSVKAPKKQTKQETLTKPSYSDMPPVISKIYQDKATSEKIQEIQNDKSFLVQKKLDQGMTPEEIAASLNCSITEIQFIIDML